MLIVQNCILTDDIVDQRFDCNLAQCHGRCCIEGDYGAPLTSDETETITNILPQIEPYMTPEGRKAITKQGVSVPDNDNEPTTPLIDGRECAYICHGTNGTALCAIEAACRDGKCSFLKPISCHLYPLRLDDFGQFISINYHRWEVCRSAAGHGQPLYRYLKEPLIRRFGQEWYDELLDQVDEYLARKKNGATQ
ncbi:MAG: DUF3109 family protein [Bacteroidales bacterium]|nr:DUF3109 family protein [Bacteroidales bacterium]